MPVCNKCNKFSNVLTVDVCVHCGAKDWAESLHDKTLREHSERYAKMTPAQRARSSQSLAAQGNKSGIAETLGGLIILGVLGLIVWSILPDSWTDKIKCSMEYSVDLAQVRRNIKPTDCDFMHAPLGDKSCHYKKTVSAYNAAGDAVAGDDAPKYAKNTYGNTIVSYDEGKTWTVLDTPAPDLRIKSVEIGWTKVAD